MKKKIAKIYKDMAKQILPKDAATVYTQKIGKLEVQMHDRIKQTIDVPGQIILGVCQRRIYQSMKKAHRNATIR